MIFWIQYLAEVGMMGSACKKLDIGCGKQKVPGAIGVDFNGNLNADVIHDLNVFPYPFEDGEFDEVHIIDTLILLNDPVKVMEEVYRICKTGGLVVIRSPYFRSVWAFADPWIKNFCAVHSVAFYDPDDLICQRYQYSTARFKTVAIAFNQGFPCRFFERLVVAFANRFPRRYELYLSHLLPLDSITFNLKKI